MIMPSETPSAEYTDNNRYLERSTLHVARVRARFIETEVLPDLGISGEQVWQKFSSG